MKIRLTDEQFNELLKEAVTPYSDKETKLGWVTIEHEPSRMYLYYELEIKDGLSKIQCIEANDSQERWCGSDEEYFKHIFFNERHKLSELNNECPGCFTPMIYKFNYCPKCGHVLQWEDE